MFQSFRLLLLVILSHVLGLWLLLLLILLILPHVLGLWLLLLLLLLLLLVLLLLAIFIQDLSSASSRQDSLWWDNLTGERNDKVQFSQVNFSLLCCVFLCLIIFDFTLKVASQVSHLWGFWSEWCCARCCDKLWLVRNDLLQVLHRNPSPKWVCFICRARLWFNV